MKVRFGRDAREILCSRLSVGDCIAEALAEQFPDADAVEAEADRLYRLLLAGQEVEVDELGLEVLVDAADGSVWFGNKDDFDLQELGRWSKAAREIERVLSDLYEAPVLVPRN